MKLSEAIRKGAKLRPQTKRGRYFDDGCSCAIGAAYEAMTARVVDHYTSSLASHHELQKFMQSTFPCLHDSTKRAGWSDTYNDIVRMNDKTYKTREQIADWLEAQGL